MTADDDPESWPAGVRFREYLLKPVTRGSWPCPEPVLRRDREHDRFPAVGAVAWRWMGEAAWRAIR